MKKSTLALIVVLIVLAIAAWFALNQPGEQFKDPDEKEYFVKLDSSKIDKIVITNQFGRFTIAKSGKQWKLIEPIASLADQIRARRTLSILGDLKISDMVSTNPKKAGIYGLDSLNRKEIIVYQSGAEKTRFFVGNPATAPIETYMKMPDADEVYSVKGALHVPVKSPLKDWRDRRIIKPDTAAINEITYDYGSEEFTIIRNDSSWTLDGQQVYQPEVTSLMRAIVDFQTDFFIDENPEELPDVSVAISFGKDQIIFRRIDDESFYVSSTDSPQLYKVLQFKANSVLKKRNDFLPE